MELPVGGELIAMSEGMDRGSAKGGTEERSQIFEELAGLAAQICGASWAGVILREGDRSHWVAQAGDETICPQWENGPELETAVVVFEEGVAEQGLSQICAGIGSDRVRFAVGIRLDTESGKSMGQLWLLDSQPKILSLNQVEALKVLARQGMRQVKLQDEVALLSDKVERVEADGSESGQFFNLSLDLLCVAGLDGYFRRINPAFERVLGYTQAELLEVSFLSLVHPEDYGATVAEMERLTTGVPTIHFANRFRCKDGSYCWLDWNSFPVAEQGLLYAVARDITGQKAVEAERLVLLERSQAAQAAAELSQNRMVQILESITDAFFALDPEWRFVYLNQQSEPLLQRSRAELLGQNIWEAFPEAVGSQFYQEYHRAVEQRVSVTFEALYSPLQAWFKVHAYPSEEGLSVYFENVTARKQAEEALRLQNLRSRLLAEISLKIRQSLHLDEILQTTVTEVKKILQGDRVLIFRFLASGVGQVVQEAVEPGWSPALGLMVKDDCLGTDYLKKYRQGRCYRLTDVETANLEPCLVEFMQQLEVRSKLVMPILLKDHLWGLVIVHQCNRARQWSEFEVDLLRQLADQIGIALAQAQLLEQETRQRQALARSNLELQQFAYAASHDLQEPLRKIQAFGDRLKAKYADVLTEQGRDYLERMQNAAQRMQVLINDLLMLSRVTTKAQPFIATDLNIVIQEVLSNLEIRIQQSGGKIEVEPLPTLDADPIQMQQLFQNLISNALKFHLPNTAPHVRIYSRLLPQAQKNSPVNGPDQGCCQIFVTDNGIGFEEKYLDRIFNAFQRLHGRGEYEGTGIGLAICRKITERHHGAIAANSAPGQGATFIVTLPFHQPNPSLASHTLQETYNHEGTR